MYVCRQGEWGKNVCTSFMDSPLLDCPSYIVNSFDTVLYPITLYVYISSVINGTEVFKGISILIRIFYVKIFDLPILLSHLLITLYSSI